MTAAHRRPHLHPALRALGAVRVLGAVIAIAAITMVAAAHAQDQAWELRICAPPHALPFSTDDREGFENEIAAILADELDARLTYEWIPTTLSGSRTGLLRTGECDALMGISEGHEGFLTTLAYYRSIYVFVYPEASDVAVTSFDDPELQDLTVALARSGGVEPPVQALTSRGMIDNRATFEVGGTADDRLGAPGPFPRDHP